MHLAGDTQIPTAAQQILQQFSAIHQVETLAPVGGEFVAALGEAARHYPVAQRMVLTGAGELGQSRCSGR